MLSTPFLRDVFLTMYFICKRHLEDPFYGLVTSRPELFQQGHILDIGSNVGFTVSLFASVVSEGFQVHAFEPEPKNIDLLKRVVRKKNISSKVCINSFAIGNKVGKVQLMVNQLHHADHVVINSKSPPTNISTRLISVPCTTIDDYWKSLPEPRRVSFIKIDVQGFEPAVFEGMQELLKSQDNVIVAIEFEPESIRKLGFSPEAVLTFLNGCKGRCVFKITKDGRIHRLDKINPTIHADTLNLLLAPETLLL